MERYFTYKGFQEPVTLKLDHYAGTPSWLIDAVLVAVGVAMLMGGLAIAYGR